jgi:crotonobetainyl-CoA:carnitine CoA-transferase CaiB-like acyl-CoA transferase
MGSVPALGQHSESILRELGFAAAAIEAWREDGMI